VKQKNAGMVTVSSRKSYERQNAVLIYLLPTANKTLLLIKNRLKLIQS
tara:strand:+ start:79 stop:222 length:144 start_codon:yes stop_codon:yes gene_type:complete